jgi:ubiquinone/menaquinone biosynthesis C-methylase UbiE
VDSLHEYLNEIDSVREIYTKEFGISGKVLDVGGHQGRLRHYLDDDVSLYVSIDPFVNVFERMDKQPKLIEAYPCLLEPCNFLCADAELLPFKSESFDWIHMRSSVDHFADPFQAFLEAFRCCKTGGNLLVGLAIVDKIHEHAHFASDLPLRFVVFNKIINKLRAEGVDGLGKSIWRKLTKKDDHIYRFTYEQLLDLFRKTGWKIVKEHWQKPPFDFCIYASAEKVIQGQPISDWAAF